MTAREQRAQLRAAAYGANGDLLVGLLQGRTPPDDVLQLVGDALCAAVAQGVDGASDLAAECATQLRARGWFGDDELADQLEAQLGQGATPLLKSLPISLDELSGILEGDPLYGGGRIDRQTGEIWPRPAIEYAQEVGDEDENESDDSAHWLWVECEGSRDGYRDMEMFVGTVTDPDRARRLDAALARNGPFRRFRDALDRWPDELERWSAFSEERRFGRARAWLAAAGYRVDPARGPEGG